MSFSPLNQPFDYIRSLPDRPRLSEGYTPEDIKERFDRAGVTLKDYINNVLLPALENQDAGESAAEAIGSAAVGDIPAGTLHAQLCRLREENVALEGLLKDAAAGLFVPDSIAFSHLNTDLRASISAAEKKDLSIAVFTTAGEHSFTVPKTGLYRLRMCGAGGGGTYYNSRIQSGDVPEAGVNFPCRGGAAGASLEAFLPLIKGEEFIFRLGRGGAPSEVVKGPSSSEDALSMDDLQAHMDTGEWGSCGEDSTLSHSETGLYFTCEGGNAMRARARATASTDRAEALFLHAGEAADTDCTLGLSSTLGAGGELLSDGNTIIAPVCGGGGSGALLYLSAPLFDTKCAPTAGADGAAILEFIHY